MTAADAIWKYDVHHMIKAVLFDMDGVLVDSEELIYLASRQMFEEHGIDVTKEDFIPFIGTGEDSYLGNVAKKYRFPLDINRDKARTYEIYAQIAPCKLKLLPGVVSFIKKCKIRNLRLAVATSADEVKMIVNLKAAGLYTGVFNSTVNGLEVARKKPHPDIYLKAAEKLDVEPSACLVVEDAVNGVEAAKASGARCLAVTTSFTAIELAKADWIVNNLSEASDDVLSW
jgi:beta-phosphoglucomutase